MKVSAPSFMSSTAPPADAPVTPAPELPADPSAPPPPAEPPKLATWPTWFAAVDNALIVLALLFAFLMASFAARNTDIYRHLAAGKRLLNGTYALGSDPFSYTGESRPWVNQSWLFDLTAYAAYSVDHTGAVAVVLKAFAFAAAFGALLAFRRPGHAGWPWAVMIAAAALAGGGSAHLRPIVFGVLFFSLLLLLVFRGDWGAGRMRTLLLVGAVSWLWGGFDSFAILAPLLLVAIVAGSWVQALLTAPLPPPVAIPPVLAGDGEPSPNPVPEPSPPPAPEPSPPPEPEPSPPPAPEPDVLYSPPDVRTLLLAAAVTLLGVLLNPTFVIGLSKSPADAVAQLVPYELSFSGVLADDLLLREQSYSLLTPDYWKPTLGLNVGSVGLAVLVLAGAAGMALGIGRLPVAWVALWAAALLFGFVHYRFVVFFAVVAVPLVAGLLNAVSARLPLGAVADGQTQALLAASRLGRIVCVPAFLFLVVATIPGWLHPPSSEAALVRRVEWRIAGDEAYVRGVERLQQWRESGALPENARGLIVHPEFGDYAAWFAPAEKVFVNGRLRFHAAELPGLATAREALLYPKRDAPRKSAAALADELKAEYVALGRPFGSTNWAALGNVVLDLSPDWQDVSALWYLDGRTAIVGRANSPRAAALRERLAIAPARLAFAPQTPLPEGPVQSPNPDAGWLAKLLLPLPQQAAFRDDGMALQQLAVWTANTEEQKHQIAADRASIAVGPWARFARRPITDAEWAFPLILHRSARQAVHQTPDDPAAHALVADAFQAPFLPEFEPRDAARQRLTALYRASERLAQADQATASQRQEILFVQGNLFIAQIELGQLDFARDAVKELRKLLVAVEADGLPPPVRSEFWQTLARCLDVIAPHYRTATGQDLAFGKDEFQFEEQAKKSGRNELPPTVTLMKKLEDATTAVVGRVNDEWDRSTRQQKPGQRAIRAAQMGLSKAGIAGLEDARKLSGESAGMDPFQIVLNLVNLELDVGHLEQADAYLKKLEEELAGKEMAKFGLAELKLKKLRRQGNYKEAIAVLDELARGRLPQLSEDDKALAVVNLPTSSLQLFATTGGFGTLIKVTPFPPNIPVELLPQFLANLQRQEMDRHPLGRANQPRLTLLNEARHYFQRGMLDLLAGDLPKARESFAQAIAPQGIPIETVVGLTKQAFARFGVPSQLVDQAYPALEMARQYIRLIDRYANTPNPGAAK